MRPELPVAHTLGERVQQPVSHRLADPLPEAFKEFGVTAFLSQETCQDGRPVLADQVDPQVFQEHQGAGPRFKRCAQKRLERHDVDGRHDEIGLLRNLRRKLGGVVPAAAAAPPRDVPR
jgi:hypothetical protein